MASLANFSCPKCNFITNIEASLEIHVNMKHNIAITNDSLLCQEFVPTVVSVPPTISDGCVKRGRGRPAKKVGGSVTTSADQGSFNSHEQLNTTDTAVPKVLPDNDLRSKATSKPRKNKKVPLLQKVDVAPVSRLFSLFQESGLSSDPIVGEELTEEIKLEDVPHLWSSIELENELFREGLLKVFELNLSTEEAARQLAVSEETLVSYVAYIRKQLLDAGITVRFSPCLAYLRSKPKAVFEVKNVKCETSDLYQDSIELPCSLSQSKIVYEKNNAFFAGALQSHSGNMCVANASSYCDDYEAEVSVELRKSLQTIASCEVANERHTADSISAFSSPENFSKPSASKSCLKSSGKQPSKEWTGKKSALFECIKQMKQQHKDIPPIWRTIVKDDFREAVAVVFQKGLRISEVAKPFGLRRASLHWHVSRVVEKLKEMGFTDGQNSLDVNSKLQKSKAKPKSTGTNLGPATTDAQHCQSEVGSRQTDFCNMDSEDNAVDKRKPKPNAFFKANVSKKRAILGGGISKSKKPKMAEINGPSNTKPTLRPKRAELNSRRVWSPTDFDNSTSKNNHLPQSNLDSELPASSGSSSASISQNNTNVARSSLDMVRRLNRRRGRSHSNSLLEALPAKSYTTSGVFFDSVKKNGSSGELLKMDSSKNRQHLLDLLGSKEMLEAGYPPPIWRDVEDCSYTRAMRLIYEDGISSDDVARRCHLNQKTLELYCLRVKTTLLEQGYQGWSGYRFNKLFPEPENNDHGNGNSYGSTVDLKRITATSSQKLSGKRKSTPIVAVERSTSSEDANVDTNGRGTCRRLSMNSEKSAHKRSSFNMKKPEALKPITRRLRIINHSTKNGVSEEIKPDHMCTAPMVSSTNTTEVQSSLYTSSTFVALSGVALEDQCNNPLVLEKVQNALSFAEPFSTTPPNSGMELLIQAVCAVVEGKAIVEEAARVFELAEQMVAEHVKIVYQSYPELQDLNSESEVPLSADAKAASSSAKRASSVLLPKTVSSKLYKSSFLSCSQEADFCNFLRLMKFGGFKVEPELGMEMAVELAVNSGHSKTEALLYFTKQWFNEIKLSV